MGKVLSLVYIFDSLTEYEAKPVEFEANGIRFSLEDNLLVAKFDEPQSTISDGRKAVEPILRDWIVQAKLLERDSAFQFTFQGAQVSGVVVDADSHPPEPVRYSHDEDEELVITMTRYPLPPVIKTTPELEAASDRVYRGGSRFGLGEPLQSAAYFALTLAEKSAGSRRAAAKRFNIDEKILAKIGELSSTRGDASTARKASHHDLVALSAEEHRWLDRAARFLLLQIGQVNAGRAPDQLTTEHVGPIPAA